LLPAYLRLPSLGEHPLISGSSLKSYVIASEPQENKKKSCQRNPAGPAFQQILRKNFQYFLEKRKIAPLITRDRIIVTPYTGAFVGVGRVPGVSVAGTLMIVPPLTLATVE